jgi:hypothetical protein
MKGFPPKRSELVVRFVEGGRVGIRVNNDTGHYFRTSKGLRQEDPLLPILFNIGTDMLAILIARVKADG